MLWSGVYEVLWSGSSVYDKCSGVASDLLWSGFIVAPEIKFMFIYDTIWGIWQGFGFAPENKFMFIYGFKVAPEIKFVFKKGIIWGMISAQEWLKSCSRNEVCVHI